MRTRHGGKFDHFSGATQIGLTATPKETEYVSNIDYFGEPIYTYSLKQGISDGFLAPYKVIKVHIDRDVEGYRPELGQLDRDGNAIEDRIYNTKDFDRNIVLDDRTVLTAKKITEFLKESGDRFQKTIIFCVDESTRRGCARRRQPERRPGRRESALRHAHHRRREEGQDQLGNFIDRIGYPVLVTTSRYQPASMRRPSPNRARSRWPDDRVPAECRRGTRVHETQRSRLHVDRLCGATFIR
jgi:type I restriction enzyme R subunit